MRILWIEDKPKIDQLEKRLFDDCPIFKSGLHSITNPTTFEDSVQEINRAHSDYDLIVLDINLEDFAYTDTELSSKFNLSPKEFLKVSGFYLYHLLIQQGFKNERILFLTGNTLKSSQIRKLFEILYGSKNVEEFISTAESINQILSEDNSNKFQEAINKYENTGNYQSIEEFEKEYLTEIKNKDINDSYEDFEKRFKQALLPLAQAIHKDLLKNFHQWLTDKMTIKNAEFSYITLRRGVIEACRFLKEDLRKKIERDLNDYLLFYKTTDVKVGDDLEAYRKYSDDYLTKLENFFPLNSPENKSSLYSLFLKELSSDWESSKGYYQKDSVDFKGVEKNFKNAVQYQMKLLRNWTSHNQMSEEIGEREAAFFFMIAMRAWFNLPVIPILNYEKILEEIFAEHRKSISEGEIYKMLASSYSDLRKKLEKKLKITPDGNEFSNLIKSYGKLLDKKSSKNKNDAKKKSIKLFYQNFWHGLYPAKVQISPSKETANEVLLKIQFFEYKQDIKNLFPFFLGELIYHSAFQKK